MKIKTARFIWGRESMLRSLFTILVSGIGNVKYGNWKSSSVYFGFLVLIGSGLYYLERLFIEPYFSPSQTMRTFLVLVFIAFAFFWDGTALLKKEGRENFFNHEDRNKENSDNKDRGSEKSNPVDHS